MAYSTRDRGGDNYRPQYRRDDGPPQPPAGMFHFRGAAGGGRGRNDGIGRPDFTFRARTKISDRPLLRPRHDPKEENILGNAHKQGEKFRHLDELTDSDEAEMEGSEDEEDGPSRKRAKVADAQTIEQNKWSNPDVYTSLPAPSETTGKRLDFVKLIRKAKNANMKSTDLMTNDEDFISFDALDGAGAPPADAPTGPRAQDTDLALGKRKRGTEAGAKPNRRRGRGNYQDGMVLDQWRAKDGVHPTPWLQLHQDESAGLALHKEIIDFYDWVKPRDYEFQVRASVIDRLSAALNRIEPGELKAFGSYAAGLYLPTGDMDLVYLPRGYNQRRGYQVGISSHQFRKYGDFIKRSGVAQNGSLLMIGKAKVPIIKFVEKVSGLKVDLSFNNDTGVVAIDTFRRWREQYPAMPIIVSIVKQFLMIRGLNDVSVGGLGGFSIICLVTSILQHMPLTGTSPNLGEVVIEFFNVYGNLFDRETVAIRLDPPGYVDKESYKPLLAMNEKAMRLTIIDPNRPDNSIAGGTHEIETILNCFSRAHEVLQNRLADYREHDSSSGHGFSFLEDLLGGNFNAYQAQRDILYGLHHGRKGPAPAVVPPPPPPVTHEPLPPPPPPADKTTSKQDGTIANRGSAGSAAATNGTSDSSKTSSKASTKKSLSKAERRAIRLKTFRPELTPLVGRSINVVDAIKAGGYEDYNEMDKDLTRREQEAKEQ